MPLALFDFFAQALAMAGVHEVEFVVKAQLPIAPEGLAIQDSTLALGGVWIGLAEDEIWLLLRPQSEYPQDLLPS